ncbi:MAG TPA: MOSC domain-containing protein [Woeseiaceae bacterium]|nr:MOSC domain-containing protein [Woeseiaceae bacterium]
MASIHEIYRYPVKGLNPEALPSAELHPYEGIEGDRAYAIAHGQTEFDPQHPVHLGKTRFLTLMTHPRLAELQLSALPGGAQVILRRGQHRVFTGDLRSADDRASLDRFLEAFIGSEAKGPPRLVTAPGHMFSDMREDCLSIVNLASVTALGKAVGRDLDPLRFRANFYLDGLPPWQEREWRENGRLQLGECVLEIIKHITRCNAINVNPGAARVDAELTKVLFKEFDGNCMGLYANVITPGVVRLGDRVEYPGYARQKDE